MEKQALIQALLREDLKHHQLLLGLGQLGIAAEEMHSLRLWEIVASLMQVPAAKAEAWDRTYLACMQEAVNYRISQRGEALQPLVTKCYGQLEAVLRS